MDDSKQEARGPLLSALFRAWFEMTVEEQRSLIMVLALFLLGTATRLWHLCFWNGPAS